MSSRLLKLIKKNHIRGNIKNRRSPNFESYSNLNQINDKNMKIIKYDLDCNFNSNYLN